jgi:hypothetical protein
MRLAFSLIFAASGAAALVYEVTWTRLLTLQLGHGVAAASTVLAAFMGGLAAGAAIGGRVGSRVAPRQALRVYAALELGIGALALILPFELRALDPLFTWAYDDGNAGTSFAFLRLQRSPSPRAGSCSTRRAPHVMRARFTPQTPWAPPPVHCSPVSCCCHSWV